MKKINILLIFIILISITGCTTKHRGPRQISLFGDEDLIGGETSTSSIKKDVLSRLILVKITNSSPLIFILLSFVQIFFIE